MVTRHLLMHLVPNLLFVPFHLSRVPVLYHNFQNDLLCFSECMLGV